MILYLPKLFAMFAAGAFNTPTPVTAINTPVRRTKDPIRRRGFRKADREADCFFMGGNDGNLEFECESFAHTQNTRSLSTLVHCGFLQFSLNSLD
jgi:hypothetical protein